MLVQSCPERTIWWLDSSRSKKNSVKKVNRGTVIDMPWWYRTWQHSGYNHTRVKQKLPRRPGRAYRSSWSQQESLKSFTLTIPWNVASLARNYPGIVVRQRHTDQKRMGLLREQSVEWKKVHLRCYWSPVWTTNGERILWNVTAICEIFRINFPMGEHLTKGCSEYLARL